MQGAAIIQKLLAAFPRVAVCHAPTPIEAMSRLGAAYSLDLSVKRDDCTGLAFGGNKVRQLEFYIGAAVEARADVVLITSAAQSNFMRMTAAMAARFGMKARLQLEERVPDPSPLYRQNGNILLDRLIGAEFASYPEGEDEAGADAAVLAAAAALSSAGARPYVIPLGAGHAPLGALGYVEAAAELVAQEAALGAFDAIVVGSGSALTHAGLLVGLRALGRRTTVYGVCVRRDAASQAARTFRRCQALEAMLGLPKTVTAADVHLHDGALAPGYGRLNEATIRAIRQTAELEGLFLDPVYTGKAMAGLIQQAEALRGQRVLFWHTGGQPALFAYADQLTAAMDGPAGPA